MHMILRSALCAVLCMGIVSPANPALAQAAAPGAAAAPQQQAQQSSPDSQFIQDIGNQAITVMANKKPSAGTKTTKIPGYPAEFVRYGDHRQIRARPLLEQRLATTAAGVHETVSGYRAHDLRR